MAKIQLRRDTAANWATVNPTLAAGEIGYETDTGRVKIGDGATAWNTLPYSWVRLKEFETRARFLGRADPQPLPVLVSSFARIPNGSAPTAFDSGQLASVTLSGAVTLGVEDGHLVADPSGAGTQAAYYSSASLGSTVTRIGARFRMKPGEGTRTAGGTVAIAITQYDWSLVPLASQNMPLHISYGNGGWNIGVIVAGSLSVLDSGVPVTPMLIDSSTEYEIEAWINGTTMTVDLPDGARRVVTDSRIATYAGQFVFCEQFLGIGAGDDIACFSHVWADTSPAAIPSARQLAPAFREASAKATGTPFLAGNYYRPVTGRTTTTAVMGGTGVVSCGARFLAGRTTVITNLAVNVTAAGSSGATVRMGLYEIDLKTLSTRLIADFGTTAATSTGVKTTTGSAPIVQGKDYLAVAFAQGGTTKPTMTHTSDHDMLLGLADPANAYLFALGGVQATYVSGALPSSLSGAVAAGAGVMVLAMAAA